jgi:hypothetical protein
MEVGGGGSDSCLPAQLRTAIISENLPREKKNRGLISNLQPAIKLRPENAPNFCQTNGLNRPRSIIEQDPSKGCQ